MSETKSGELVIHHDDEFLDKLREYNNRSYKADTPETKVKKRPDGYPYVSGSYMNKLFTDLFPLYEFTNLEVTDVPQWGIVRVTLILVDRTSGNSQPGVGAARIQISREAKKKPVHEITPFDLIDYDKNVKSALTNAIKNAQSRFGVAADVYQKREFTPTPEEQERYEELVKDAPATKKVVITEAWNNLGDGFTDFLDSVEAKLEKARARENINKPKTDNNKEGSIL